MKGSWPLGKPQYLGWTALAVAATAMAQEPEQRAAPQAAQQAVRWVAPETAQRSEQQGAPPTKSGVGAAVALELDPATAVVLIDGKRASLAAAQRIKRDQLAVVDAVVAEQVQTLPDFSVTDALQRITGVQIARDRGEGANVAIRGLTQMETTINGREVFTAGTGRNLDFADYPAEMVAGIDVYKSSSADQLDGGIGGIIDLRTRRPFDFAGRQLAATVRLVRDDLAQRSRGQWSVLASQRWRGVGDGELGLLLNLVRQQRAWREDQASTAPLAARNDLVGGRTVYAPAGTTESASAGQRERNGVSAALQWRPAPGMEMYAEGSYAELRTRQDTYQITLGAPATVAPGSVTLFPGTANVRGVTWVDAPAGILSFARDTVDRDRSVAVGGQWRQGALWLKLDASHSASHNDLYFAGPQLNGRATYSQDLSTEVPQAQVPGDELLDPARLQVASIAYRVRPFDGHLNALHASGEYRLAGDWLAALAAGLRYASRGADDGNGTVFGDAAVAPGLTLAGVPGLATGYPFAAYFPGGGQTVRNYLVGDLGLARDAAALRAAAGLSPVLPTVSNVFSIWRIHERTAAAYVQARFAATALPLDGNAGLRLVRSWETVQGNQSLPATGRTGPIGIDHAYGDVLPSVNVRYKLRPDLDLRAAASRTMTRPNFDQLSPSLSLVPNTVTPSTNSGSAGNPALRPIRSDNLDLALEHYAGPATSATVTLFRKNVDGFIANASRAETYDGVLYQVSRPYNSSRATIQGAELGYQRLYDFLPGWLNGLGLQANYTYVDSSTPSSVLGGNVPLQNLSRHSANVVGLYERNRVSARIAYNWRDRFFSGTSNVAGQGTLPVYTRAYGWLDASLACKFSGRLTVQLAGSNLLRTTRSAYYGGTTLSQSAWINDRQISVTAMLRY